MRALIVSADHFEDTELFCSRYTGCGKQGLQVDIASACPGENQWQSTATKLFRRPKALRDVGPERLRPARSSRAARPPTKTPQGAGRHRDSRRISCAATKPVARHFATGHRS